MSIDISVLKVVAVVDKVKVRAACRCRSVVTDECGYAASNIVNGNCPDPCGGGTDTGCPDGLWDCGNGECINPSWVCDGSSEFCNASWGPDCSNGADEGLDFCGYTDECGAGHTCADGSAVDYPEDCTSCAYDWTAFGAATCDAAWASFGLTCAQLESNYFWDCTGCECPGDVAPACGDGLCNGDETSDSCPSDCLDLTGCVNDDSTADSYGDTCSSWYDTNEQVGSFGCSGAYDTADFSAAEQCCVCGGGSYDDGGDDGGDDDAGTCADTDNGATDAYGDGCAAYNDYPSWCGGYDDDDFNSLEMCCICGGGDSGDSSSTCDDETACNYGAEGDCTYADAGYNCDGSIADGYHVDCAGSVLSDSYLSWQGDGYCDDGAYGVNYLCCEFNFDNGDCGDALGCGGIAEGCEGSEADACGNCDGDGTGGTGDLNADCDINVLDVITLVYAIVDATDLEGGDLNGDGSINVADAVALVNIILGSGRVADATSASMILADNSVSITADGYIGGVQMTLSHDNGFELNLTDNAMVAEYKTSGTSTILVVVEPNDELIFTTNQSFEIVDMIVANSNDEIEVNTISEFGLSTAYPNPFNPSTSVSLTVPSADYVSVKVYNLMGQMVGTLAEGMMEASVYTFTWDASDMSSGVYLIKAESSSSVDIQKVLLVK